MPIFLRFNDSDLLCQEGNILSATLTDDYVRIAFGANFGEFKDLPLATGGQNIWDWATHPVRCNDYRMGGIVIEQLEEGGYEWSVGGASGVSRDPDGNIRGYTTRRAAAAAVADAIPELGFGGDEE